MDIEFIDENQLPQGPGRPAIYNDRFEVFMETLLAHPDAIGKWAKMPFEIPHATVVSMAWRKKYPECKFRCSGGNNLNVKDPNKKLWTIYVKYEPKG